MREEAKRSVNKPGPGFSPPPQAMRAQTEAEENKAYDANGDMITKDGQLFRQVGWQINGGANDGVLLPKNEWNDHMLSVQMPHGGFSPVYVEVGKD